MNERAPGRGRRCEICQVVVPANPADEALGDIEGYPPSLIEHRWSAHALPGVTRCPECGIAVPTNVLANHLSCEHDLPPPSDAQRAQYVAGQIRDEIKALGDKITEAGDESTKRLDALQQELRGLRTGALFWIILVAVMAAELAYPLVRAIFDFAQRTIGAGLR